MDVEVKLEHIDRNLIEEIEPIIETHTKKEKELIIDSDWLTNHIEDDENENYQNFMEESKQNNLSETVVTTDGGCVKYVIENLDESDFEEYDYEDGDDTYVENDSCEKDCFYTAEQASPEDASESKPVYQLVFNKWIAENYIGRECPLCKENLSNNKEFRRHVIERHKESLEESESNYYFSIGNCGVCKNSNQKFNTQYSRHIHLTKHNEECSDSYSIHNCKICNYKSKRSLVQNHILKKHPEVIQEFDPSYCLNSLMCPICSNTYLKRFQLYYHFMDKHPHEYKSKFCFNCPLCKDGHYSEKEMFLKHLSETHFLNSGEMLNYRKVFEDKEYLACTECNRLFFQNDTCKLLSHYLKHKNKFYWSCKFCNKEISFKTSPLSHMCVQMMQYYEKSNDASKLTRKSRPKIKNLQEFEERIAHVCPFCNREFNRMLKWHHHMRTDHAINTLKGLQMKVADNDNNKLKCLTCFAVVVNLTQQVHEHSFQHLPYKPYKCIICLKILDTFQMAFDHILKRCRDEDDSTYDVRSILKIQCSFCNFQEIDGLESVLKHYEDEHNYFEHFFVKRSDNSMTCKICQKKCDQYEKKICFQHLHHHFDEKTFKCKLCLLSYPSYKTFSEHLSQFHNAKTLNKDSTFKLRDFITHIDRYKMRYKNNEKSDDIKFNSSKSNQLNIVDIVPETGTEHTNVIKKWNVLKEFEEFIFYVCPECNEGMTTQEHWHSHIRAQHKFFHESNLYVKEADGSLKCGTCGIWLSSRSCQQQRHKLTHMPYKSFMCNLCNDRSSFLDGIYAHLRRKHFTQGIFECPICSDVLETEYERTEHIKKHHNRREWPKSICLICYKTFTSTRVLNHHMANHKENRFKYNCDICGFQEFFKLKDLKSHLDGHKKRSEIKERLAGDISMRSSSTSSQANYNSDIEIGVECEGSASCKIKNEMCDDISQQNSFADSGSNDTDDMETERKKCRTTSPCASPNSLSNDSYENVSESVTEEINKNKKSYERKLLAKYMSFACPECNAGMTTQEDWHNHIKAQHNIFDESNLYVSDTNGTIKCPTCKITVDTRAYQQQRHKLTHLKYKSFICNLCYERYSSLDGIRAHFRRKHFVEGTFECPICLEVLQTLHERMEHLKNAHPRKEWPDKMCTICHKIFSTKSRLNHHMNTHNAGRFKYTCDVCGIRICNAKTFRLHVERHKNRGETSENWSDPKCSQFRVRKIQSKEAGFEVVPESENVNKRKSSTNPSETKKIS